MKGKILLMLGVFFTFLTTGFAQQQSTIKGEVKDTAGIPMPEVAIQIKGTSKGVTTDFDGYFSLEVSKGAVLVFTYNGFATQEVIVKNFAKLNITMEEEAQQIEEVVVVGYSAVKKGDYTGTATQIKRENIENKSVANLTQALAGEAAGVQVISTGRPGSTAKIRVRGVGSVNGNRNPLYVLDGVVFEGELSSINPDDMESMVVLKDATATAIYGARGANGVVVITTKKGKKNFSNIQVDTKVGFNTELLPRYNVIKSPELFTELGWEGLRNRGIITKEANPEEYASKNLFNRRLGMPDMYNIWNTNNDQVIDHATGKLRNGLTRKYSPENWADYAYQTALRTENNLSISGGSENTTYYTNLGHLKEEGYLINSGFERYSGRVNLTHQARPWLKGEMNFGYAHSKSRTNGQAESSSNVFWLVDNMPPIYPLFLRDENGNKIADPHFGGYQYDYGVTGRRFAGQTNALAGAFYNNDNSLIDEFNGNAFLKADIIKGLSFETRLGVQYRNIARSIYTNPFYGDSSGVGGTTEQQRTYIFSHSFLQALRYGKRLGSDHRLDLFVAHESNAWKRSRLLGSKTNLIDPFGSEFNNAIVQLPVFSYIWENNMESYFGQANYDYKGKYHFSGTLRRDGSSRFLRNKWGTFGSVGMAWSASREKFLENNNYIHNLKVKASYGILGDQTTGDDIFYPGYDVYEPANFMGDLAVSFSRSGYPNLTWEASKIAQVGFEVSLLPSKAIDLSVDYYHKRTTDLIFSMRTATSTGNGISQVNDGELVNRGLEFAITGHLLNNPEQNYFLDVSVNGEMLTNKLTHMPFDPSFGREKVIDISDIYGRSVGHSLFDFYTYESRGVDPKTGLAQWTQHYVDNNNNQEFDSEDTHISSLTDFIAQNPNAIISEGITTTYTNATKKYIGKSAIPDLRGGISLRGGYKGFAIGIQFLYSIGGYGYDNKYASLMHNNSPGQNNWHKDILNRWQKQGDATDVPMLSGGESKGSYANAVSSRFVTKTSYLALNNINISYDVPKDFLKKSFFSGIKFTVSGDNLWLLTARKGFNPTAHEEGRSDRYLYSPLSTISFGTRFNF